MNDKFSITLTVNEWNIILGILAKQPYEMSATLIQQIQVQAQNQTNTMAQQQTVPAGLAVNGLGPIPPAVDFAPRGGE